MKIAKLHNGIELTFPDGTSNKMMDKTVKNFLKTEIEGEQEATNLSMLIEGMFSKIEKRFNEIKNTILSIPKSPLPEKIDLSKLENSALETRNSLSKITNQLKPFEQYSGNIQQQLGNLVKATLDNHPAQNSAVMRKEITAIAAYLAESFDQALKKSQEELQKKMAIIFNEQMDSLKKVIIDNSEKTSEATRDNAIVIVDAIMAPKDIIFDKKTGRPIGVKVKE